MFNETALTYKRGTSNFSDGEGDSMTHTETDVNEIHLGINPGVAVYITKMCVRKCPLELPDLSIVGRNNGMTQER